jgi:uncharacterized membrane protein
MAGLFDVSQQQQAQAQGGLLQAAHLETQRDIAKKQMDAQHRQAQYGMTAAGGAAGAAIGSQIGSGYPVVGTVIGAAIGYLVGELM